MTTPLEQLVLAWTVDDAKALIYDALTARGVNHASWKPGSVVRTLITAVAIIIAAASALTAALARAGFLDLAEGAWLTLKARYDYGVERDLGSFALAALERTKDAAEAGAMSRLLGALETPPP